jgi:hypothetical protein
MSVFKGLRPIQIKIFLAACRPPDISGLAPSPPFRHIDPSEDHNKYF